MKTCKKCGEQKELHAFYRHPYTRDRRAGTCIDCTLIQSRMRYRLRRGREGKRRRNKMAHRIAVKKHEEKVPHAVRMARRKLHRALRFGVVTIPVHCDSCGEFNPKLHATFPDLKKPLDPTWLCEDCYAGDV